MPENNWRIPLTFGYKEAMKIIQSVIYGSNYQNTCNYESIHVRKRIFDHFSHFRLSTLHRYKDINTVVVEISFYLSLCTGFHFNLDKFLDKEQYMMLRKRNAQQWLH